MNYLLSGAGDIIITDDTKAVVLPYMPPTETIRSEQPSQAIDMTHSAAGEALIGAYVKANEKKDEASKPAVVKAVQKSQFTTGTIGIFIDMYKRLYPKEGNDQIMARVNEWIKKNPLANDETMYALVAASYDSKTSILVPALLAMGAAAYFLLS